MAADQHANADKWILAMGRAAGRFGLPCDIPALRQQMRWFENLPVQRRLERLGRYSDYRSAFVQKTMSSGVMRSCR